MTITIPTFTPYRWTFWDLRNAAKTHGLVITGECSEEHIDHYFVYWAVQQHCQFSRSDICPLGPLIALLYRQARGFGFSLSEGPGQYVYNTINDAINDPAESGLTIRRLPKGKKR